MNDNEKFEKLYYEEKHKNHRIPKVYYKQWSPNKSDFKVYDKFGNLTDDTLKTITVEKDIFVIKFGDTFIPDVVLERFKKITDKYEIYINGRQENDVSRLSYSFFEENSIKIDVKLNGIESKEKLLSELDKEKCYSIENGLNLFFENGFNDLIRKIYDIFDGHEFSENETDVIIQDLFMIYFSFYLRSDATIPMINGFLDAMKCVVKIPNGFDYNKFKIELQQDYTREVLWNLMFNIERFKEEFSKVYEKMGKFNPKIYINKTTKKFHTSELPVVNSNGTVFMILSPDLLLEYVIDDVKFNRIILCEIVKDTFVTNINDKILSKSVKIVKL